ncbi:cytochrome-c oxidase, cbb3-type subunit III [Pseudomaricurvus sp. HS19]|uniref:cytochrome-c oxidase, cbb3-type subunit III n=1 Tax=Pseudomaricurvus sp. HS19 TaxID=2692626 RepID=UPI0013704081|nr:cytochrome-c oxidase, cbb3-type subunit III [Pseudomaricurvus sp. HS19]MYM63189.1 cytochrome-c oxidase, cbb3-type subunit III [Pseudomaricurvus sp. HS19]
MSTFWSLWITGLTLINLALLFWVLMANRKVAVNDDADPENKTTGHVYDGIEEYDNPLPKWWFQMFLLTFIFGFIYLALYPGLGTWKGLLGWTSHNQLEREQQKAQEQYGEIFAGFAAMPIEEVAQDPRALKMGVRLFANNCAVCHGADASGSYGFPNLTDADWLYGGSAEQIKQSITFGRNGFMPPQGPVIGEEGVVAAAEYVLQISGNDHDQVLAEKGQQIFAQTCAACHGADGKGSHLVGAPNLTDSTWLYSKGDPAELRSEIRHSVREGRTNQMPAQQEKLREDKIHLLAAYVYGLSQDAE